MISKARIITQVVAIIAASVSLYVSYRLSMHVQLGSSSNVLMRAGRSSIKVPSEAIRAPQVKPSPRIEPRITVPPLKPVEQLDSWSYKTPKQLLHGDPWAPSVPIAIPVPTVLSEVRDDTAPISIYQEHPQIITSNKEKNGEKVFDPFFGSSTDLAKHQSDAVCWNHFDFGMLHDWDAKAQMFCSPQSIPADGAISDSLLSSAELRSKLRATGEQESWLVCRVNVDAHLPAATAPHTLCDGANIVFDLTKVEASDCLRYRPGYKCDGPKVFYNYNDGAFTAACNRMPRFNPSAFPKDHLMDIFSAFSADSNTKALVSASQSAAPVTLFVTRERQEHANPFHATTDLINAFYSLHLAGIIDGITGERDGMQDVQVVLLDEQTGPFEEAFWHRVFGPNFPLLRVSTMMAQGQLKTRFRRAIFVPPGYTNLLLAHVLTDSDCHAGTQLFQSYRKFFLAGLGLHSRVPPSRQEGGAVVTFVSRRPYQKHGVDHAFMGRQMDNEEELLSVLQKFGERVKVTRVDLALIDTVEQIKLIADTEILVAMHGAALTYPLYMPEHGAVIEFWPKTFDMWRCFEHVATMSGLIYERWANPDPKRFRRDDGGDYTKIDENAFEEIFRRVLQQVEARRSTLPIRE